METATRNGKWERVLILAPTGKDGELASRVLQRAGLAVTVCSGMDQLCHELRAGAGTVFLSEEALDRSVTCLLADALGAQPSWSDVPVVVATNRYGGQAPLFALRALEALGNVTFLERPIRMMTLVSTIRTALRARRKQYQLRDLLDQLERGVQQRDDFLAMLAHELRNPLAPIRNAVKLLRMQARTQDGLDAQNVSWATELVGRQAQQLTRMVDDLLEVSRLTRGKITLRQEPVDVAAVIDQAVETSRSLIDGRQQHLTVSLPEQPCRVCADVARLVQVVTNLLNNAAKYTDEGGHIGLRVLQEGAEAILTVRDTGIGIPADLLPRVFEPFTQDARSRDRSQAGLGLGLTVARKLIEMHGGSLQAFSEGPGKGSEFVVRLPLWTERGPAAPVSESKGRTAYGTKRRGLVVDDNRDAADSLSLLLQMVGHDVRVVYDGPSALELARSFQPEVVLLDLQMPGMDGYEVVRRLRQQPGWEQVLLVAMTGFGQHEDRRRAQEAGFHAHCVKPVDLDMLQKLLARTMPRAEGCASPTADVPVSR